MNGNSAFILLKFVSGLWQIHPFGEGNTRTVAVFTIQYLRSMGFNVENDLFANYSWYFRNALVRANYQNIQQGIKRNTEYLELFFRNLLMGENNVLKNREMHIDVGVNVGVSTDKPTVKSKRLSVIGLEIIKLMENTPSITTQELALTLNRTTRTIERSIKELREKDIIVRVGSDKTGSWKIIKKH